MNIYVGNFPKASTTEDVIRKLFEEHGEVAEVKLISDRYTGELRGFGFVIMPSNDDGKKAIEAINESELEGRKLVVNEARPRENRSRGGGFRGGGNRGGNRGGNMGGSRGGGRSGGYGGGGGRHRY